MTLDDMIAQWAADNDRPLLRASVRGMERLLLAIDDPARRMAKAVELMGRDGPLFIQFVAWHLDQAKKISGAPPHTAEQVLALPVGPDSSVSRSRGRA